MNSAKLKPALIGGVSLGIASALPYLNYVNFVCCALFVAGGVLATYLYLKDLPEPPSAAPYRDGAVVGLLAGVFGGVANTMAASLLRLTGYGEEEAAQGLAQLEQSGIELPSFALEMMGLTGMTPSTILTMLVVTVVLYCIFGTLGGLLSVAIFHKKDTL